MHCIDFFYDATRIIQQRNKFSSIASLLDRVTTVALTSSGRAAILGVFLQLNLLRTAGESHTVISRIGRYFKLGFL
jgi:hypothetical protein